MEEYWQNYFAFILKKLLTIFKIAIFYFNQLPIRAIGGGIKAQERHITFTSNATQLEQMAALANPKERETS